MLENLTTERRNKKTMNVDEMSTLEFLQVMNDEDERIPQIIKAQLSNINDAIQLVIQSFQNRGKLIYVGAGTSGRLGVLDAVECGLTFSSPSHMVQGLIAGGTNAFTKAVEGAEDNLWLAKEDLKNLHLTQNDTVVAISASGRTPYAIGALQFAHEIKANTVSISCNKDAKMSELAKVAIELDTGAEVLTGSTRLKAGTAQKIVLNMISTASMIGIGKTYQNLMVDLQRTNHKLVERSKRIIIEATDVDYETASYYFDQSEQQIKTAIVMIVLHCSKEEAIERIKKANGFVRKALK